MSSQRTRILTAIPAAALVLGAGTLGAQSGGFVRSAVVAPSTQNHREIPAVAARALIAAHHMDVIDGSLEPAIVTLVLDNGLNYITSSVSKAAVIQRARDGSIAAAAGGFAVAPNAAVVRAAPTSAATTASVATPTAAGGSASAGTGGAVIAATASGPATITIGGLGPIDATLIQESFTTVYPAGEIGPNAVRVRYVILKSAPK